MEFLAMDGGFGRSDRHRRGVGAKLVSGDAVVRDDRAT